MSSSVAQVIQVADTVSLRSAVQSTNSMPSHTVRVDVIVCVCTGVSIPVDGGGLLTSWFNLDLQPRIAENGEDVVFGPDQVSSKGASNGNGTGQEDYPAVKSGARSVTAAATAPAQAVQLPRRMLSRKLRVHPAFSGMARIPMRSKMCLSARGVLAFGA